jgi:hypothetical protein
MEPLTLVKPNLPKEPELNNLHQHGQKVLDKQQAQPRSAKGANA